jgi:pilus assembly protein CpaB
MDRQKLLLIFGAAWVSAAVLVWFLYITTKTPHIEKTVAVEAAARDMPAGTLLRKSDLKTIALRENEVPRTAILNEKTAINRPLLLPVSAGELITLPKVGASGIEGLPAIIEVGMRAVTVPINDASGVAGLIPPRAHVDVLFTRPGSASEAVTSTILENVVVLAIGRITDPPPAPANGAAAQAAAAARPSAQTATLLVTPEQVRRIELAKNLGKISLSLRNPLDNAPTPEDQATATTPEEIGVIPPPPPVRPAPRVVQVAAPKPPPALPPAKEKVVEVFRGTAHVQQTFKAGSF